MANWTVTRVEQRSELTSQGGFDPVMRVHWEMNETGAQYYVDIRARDFSDETARRMVTEQAQRIAATHGLTGQA